MAKLKVEVTGAYVDGHKPGSTIEIEKKSAEYLESLGYVKKVKEAPKQDKTEGKSESKPKSKSKKK